MLGARAGTRIITEDFDTHEGRTQITKELLCHARELRFYPGEAVTLLKGFKQQRAVIKFAF